MTESTIVFTHYALLLTASTFLLLGGTIGWAVTRHLQRKRVSHLQSKLKDMKIQLAATSDSSNISTKKDKLAGKIPAALDKKKDRLLKDFMRRQVQQSKSLEKLNTTLKEERQNGLTLQSQLNTANVSLDQWKDRCSVLAAANTAIRNNLSKATKDRQQTASVKAAAVKPAAASAPATIKLSPVTISARQKTVAATPTSANKPKAAAPMNNSSLQQTAEVADQTAGEKTTKTVSTPATTKLTSINGIGPAIETALKKLGISTIEQLAKLQNQEISHLDKQLGKYSGRIERQEWVEQARQLEKPKQETEAA